MVMVYDLDKMAIRKYSEYEKTITSDMCFDYFGKYDYEYDILRCKLGFRLENRSDLEVAQVLLNFTYKALLPGNGDYEKIRYNCNSLSIMEETEKNRIKSNCYMYCTLLTELLLAYGIRARMIVCRPLNFHNNTDCHCMVHAYIRDFNKWIALDPANCASFRDASGNFINISEIRRSIVDGIHYSVFCGTKKNSKMIKDYLQHYLVSFFSFEKNYFNSYSYDESNRTNVLLPLALKKYINILPCVRISYNEKQYWSI
jgi:hypothetical protein